ncbi:MAG: potassium transporter Kup [Solirubrobacteraceae bacterium]
MATPEPAGGEPGPPQATAAPPPAAASTHERLKHPSVAHSTGVVALTLGALGVVFGDIGTSPLYALQTVFSIDHGIVRPEQANVYGVISLVFWAVTLIVSVKYLGFIMRADNEGEGGIMALIALLQSVKLSGRAAKAALIALGIFGASLFYGDGMITPAISVLSAVEGVEVTSPSLASLVVPITLAILTALFAIQRFGTGVVGRLFGPVMAVWFALLGVLGLVEVAQHPGVLRALSPTYAVDFFANEPHVAFIALGAVVLAVTGAEALYADMGHFGRSPIRRAWALLVFPALTLNYLGQGALITRSPQAIENPFFLLVPHWGRIPMVVLATVATVIASQAVISGAFSVTRQAVQLGFLPRLTIQHTSEHEVGQVYAPAVNWGVFVAVVALVVGFGSSQHLASAYGIAVTGTLAIDTILFFVVVRTRWRRPLWLVLLGGALFLTVDLAFFSANLSKVLHGGWFPLTIAAVVFVVLTTWQRGREIVTRNRIAEEGPLRRFVDELHEREDAVVRVPGTAVFLNSDKDTTPLALRTNVEHNHTLHESVVIMTIETMRVPHVAVEDRLTIDDLGYRDDGISHVTVRFGFQDDPNVPRALAQAAERGVESDVDLHACTYFLSRITIVQTDSPEMRRWRKKLFVAIARNAADPVGYFGLPIDDTITMGSQIEI